MLRPSRRTNRKRSVRDEPSAILRVRSVAAAPFPPDNPAVVRGSGCALSDMELELIWGELDEDEAGESDGQLDYEVRATRRARAAPCCARTLLALSPLVSGRLWTVRGCVVDCAALSARWRRGEQK
jgi:hypothetical protein